MLMVNKFSKGDYFDTSTNTYVSRKSHLYNTVDIEFPGGNVSDML